MHRTKVTVVEEALDANNTIASANRMDFDRAGVKAGNKGFESAAAAQPFAAQQKKSAQGA